MMRPRCFPIVAAVLFILVTTASGESVPHLERADRLINLFRTGMNVPGMSAAIVLNGQPVFTRSYGLRNLADPESNVTADTLFEIASCTKAFTSYLIAKLVREGRIAYSDPVTKHIPEFRMADADVTQHILVKDLLDHASGLPSHDPVWYHANMSRSELLERLPYLQLSYGLRERYQYSNIMYTVAGMVAERVTNRSWEEEVRERILKPLGMQRSLVSFAEAQQLPADADIARPFSTSRDNGSVVVALPRNDITSVGPSGSVHSTANDLVKWIQLQLSKSIPEEMHVVHMPHSKVSVPSGKDEDGVVTRIGYGFGWVVTLYRKQYILRHSGQTDGFNSAIALFPEENHGIVLLANLDTVTLPLAALLLRVYDIVTNRSVSMSDEEWVKKMNASVDKSCLVAARKHVPQPQQYVGHYEESGYGALEVATVASELSVLYNNIRYALEPKTAADFFSLSPQTNARTDGGEEYECSFVRDSTGEIVAVRVGFEPTASPVFFEKQFPYIHDLEYLERFEGVFSQASSSLQIRLNKEKRLLVADGVPEYEPEKLKPLKDKWFSFSHSRLLFEFVQTDAKTLRLNVRQEGEVLYTFERKNKE